MNTARAQGPLTGGSELALIRESRLRASPAGVVVTLMRESVSLAVAAMKAGASDVLRKPYRLVDVHEALQKALADRGEILARQAASERLLFFEAASNLSDLEEVSRLLGLFAQVARRSCAAEEVAVWRASSTGWNAVARGGQVQARMFQMRPNRQQRREARAKEPWAQAWRCRTHPSSQWRFEARERGWRHRKRPIPR